MRIALITASTLALAIAGCNKPTETPTPTPTATESPMDHSAMPGMSHDMADSDKADDANTAETADNFTFHTFPNKEEKVHLPAGNWTATATDAKTVEVLAGAEMTMPDGATKHYVVPVKTLASGNADVKFEKRDSAEATAPVTETRTIHFMVH